MCHSDMDLETCVNSEGRGICHSDDDVVEGLSIIEIGTILDGLVPAAVNDYLCKDYGINCDDVVPVSPETKSKVDEVNKKIANKTNAGTP